jgi:hypothetical protein
MTPTQKLALVNSLSKLTKSLCKQGIRERNPEFSDRDVEVYFVEMNYGRELAEGFRRRLERDDR